jgi:hypothetical protein
MYPAFPFSIAVQSVRNFGCRTFLLVHAEHNDDLVATDSDKLLDTADTPSREFGEQDHAIDVVVLEELHVGSHIGNLERGQFCDRNRPGALPRPAAAHGNPYLLDVDHDEGVNLGIFLLVKTAVGERHVDVGVPCPGGVVRGMGVGGWMRESVVGGEVFAKGWDLRGSGFPGLVRRFCRAEAAVKGGEWDRLKAEVTLPWQYFRDPTKKYDCGHDWKVGCVARALLGA